MPEWSPHPYALESFGEVAVIENELLSDMVRYLEAMDFELINCQSARATTSIGKHDLARYNVSIQKLEDLLTYAKTVKPLDLPETSPKAAMSPTGNIGV